MNTETSFATAEMLSWSCSVFCLVRKLPPGQRPGRSFGEEPLCMTITCLCIRMQAPAAKEELKNGSMQML